MKKVFLIFLFVPFICLAQTKSELKPVHLDYRVINNDTIEVDSSQIQTTTYTREQIQKEIDIAIAQLATYTAYINDKISKWQDMLDQLPNTASDTINMTATIV